jgi:Zn-finger protein
MSLDYFDSEEGFKHYKCTIKFCPFYEMTIKDSNIHFLDVGRIDDRSINGVIIKEPTNLTIYIRDMRYSYNLFESKLEIDPIKLEELEGFFKHLPKLVERIIKNRVLE